MKPSRGAITRKVGDELVLMDIDSDKYFHLNETGALIWELLAEGEDQHVIVGRLCDDYGIEEAEASADVSSLIEQLSNAGLISPSE